MKNNKVLIALISIATILGLYVAFRKKINEWVSTQKDKLKAELAGLTSGAIKSDVPVEYAAAQPKENKGSGSTGGGKNNTGTGVIDDFKILKRGMPKCDEVKLLQELLNNYISFVMLNPLVADGSFGAKTETALIKIANTKTITFSEARKVCAKYFPQAPQLPDGLNFLDGKRSATPTTPAVTSTDTSAQGFSPIPSFGF
jgi:hypothetical protein